MFEFQVIKTKICGAIIILEKNTYIFFGEFANQFRTALVDDQTLFLVNFKIACPCSYYWMNTSFLVNTPAVSVDFRLCRIETILPKVYDPIVRENNVFRFETDTSIKTLAFWVFWQ